ncbi:MAG: hypothetical protein IJR32_02295 [Paludibacteraceae bacterium]|nr:hypothetical protein [Paludibacteraceae bacterium]
MSESNKAGILALIVSFVIPIAGVIIYFIQKDKVSNPTAYLKCALAGVIVGLIFGKIL